LRTVAHEFGHTASLTHDGPESLMWQSKNSSSLEIFESQINEIDKYF